MANLIGIADGTRLREARLTSRARCQPSEKRPYSRALIAAGAFYRSAGCTPIRAAGTTPSMVYIAPSGSYLACPMPDAVIETELPFPLRRGKVRDVYDLGESLLLVATDRISAFDVVMPTPIPGKGKVLTALSLFWFRRFDRQIENHIITADATKFPAKLRPFASQLVGRSMLVRKCEVIPFECVARGYLDGSAWREYSTCGMVCNIRLPANLERCARLPTPIFTPATKATVGHDENTPFDVMVRALGLGPAEDLRERTLRLYTQAAAFALSRGIIIADTKFEFGRLPDGQIILIDEILTPDSSRFWPADSYGAGREQPSFDKQFLRDWLIGKQWNRRPPAPQLPGEVVQGTLARYVEAYERLVGGKLELS
jgi:phosphoribosylaminoimidazole-succinocarboxamide synthase